MKFSINNLYFSPTPLAFWLGIITLGIILILCIVGVKRSLRKKNAVILESFRIICAIAVVLVLWAPSLRKEIKPTSKPVIAILHDDSASMSTIDVRLPNTLQDKSAEAIISRKNLLEAILKGPHWEKLKLKDGGSDIALIPFSSATTTTNGSNYYQAIEDALEKYDNLKAVVILGDGDHNIGKVPSSSAQKAKLRDIPIYTVPIGSDSSLPDLEILSLSAPKYGILKETVQIPFSIKSSLGKDYSATITLKDRETGKSVTKQITLESHSVKEDSILWRLEKEKEYKFELAVSTHPSEINSTNNNQQFKIAAKQENIKVLVIDSKPRWEYRFIRNALSRDPGVDLDCLLLHPAIGNGEGPDYIAKFPEDLTQLQKYDVVFLGDIGIGEKQLTIEQCNLLKGLVEKQASGIVFIPGSSGNIHSLISSGQDNENEKDNENAPRSELADLIPVILDEEYKKGVNEENPSPLLLTDLGKNSLLTMLGDTSEDNGRIWRKLPGFNWHMPILKVKPGANVLAVHGNKRTKNNQRMPMLVTQSYGSGKVLFLAHDSAWKWRKGVEDLYHYRFWGQVARWMSYKRNRAAGENLRVYFSKDNPKPGETIIIKANAFNKEGAPLSDEHNVQVSITSPSGNNIDLTLKKEDSDWGAYISRLIIEEAGTYTFEVSTTLEPSKTLKTSLNSLNIDREKVGQPANYDTLKEIAQITEGEFIQPNEIESLTQKILKTPKIEPRVITTDLRSDLNKTKIPLIIIISIIALLSLFWMGRKLNGTF